SQDPEDLHRAFALDAYPEAGAREVELEGFLQPECEAFELRIRLEASEYRHSLTWSLPLPARSPQEVAADGFGFVANVTLDRTLRASASVVFAVLDRSLGRKEFIHHWRESTGGRVIDLDAAFRDHGLNRKYGLEPLAAESVIEALAPALEGPLLAAPADELVERLLGDESPGELDLLLEWLRSRAERDEPPLVLLLSPLHAAHLRSRNPGAILGVGGQRLLWEGGRGHGIPESELLSRALKEVARLAEFSEIRARQVIEGLGGDLALVAAWLRWQARGIDRTTRDLRDFLETPAAKERIRAELASLPAWDLLTAIAGAEARSSLPLASAGEGMSSAVPYFSTATRHASKRLLAAGEPLTRRSLTALKADARPPAQLWVEGLSEFKGGVAEAPRTHLLAVTRFRSSTDRKSTFERLAAAGVGTWAEGI
ncbi:MAG: hypothetical protein KDD47_28170, partial [Acidobacteria bacterium]|nr:hypothetical protein [Acidobacteriota bacterium]